MKNEETIIMQPDNSENTNNVKAEKEVRNGNGKRVAAVAAGAAFGRDVNGNILMRPGTLKGTKAIGWFIKEYGIAQVSMNITDIKQTPLHAAFDEVCRCAQNRGLRVTGTEIVGLLPERSLIEAGKYFLRKQNQIGRASCRERV